MKTCFIVCLMVLAMALSYVPAQAQNVERISSCSLNGQWGTSIQVRGHYAYVALDLTGLLVIDIRDPYQPMIVGTCNTPGDEAYDVYVQGAYAYLTNYLNGLYIIDVSDPTLPVIVGHYQTDGQASKIWVEGDYAYLTESDEALLILNISDPQNPVEASHVDLVNQIADVCVTGGFAYVACGQRGIKVFDVSDPAEPVLVDSSYADFQYARRVFTSDGYLYVGDNWNLRSFLVNDVGHLQPTWVYETPDYILDGRRSGDYIYLADYFGGVYIINVQNPDSIQFAGHLQFGVPAFGIDFKDSSYLVVVARESLFVAVLNPTGVVEDNSLVPDRHALSQNYPNPFNATTSIPYALTKPTDVSLDVYNITGQLVATLVRDHQAAGEYYASWDASDNSSGIYYYRLQTDETSTVKSMVLLK